MNLSDNEKKQIIQSIQNNQPIAKDLIYKMYADEEDVFLFWNGRKEDITNVVLPSHIEHIDKPIINQEFKEQGVHLRLRYITSQIIKIKI